MKKLFKFLNYFSVHNIRKMCLQYKNKDLLKIQTFYSEEIKSVKKKRKEKLQFLLKTQRINYKTIVRCTSISTKYKKKDLKD